jgi:hypothetical protein
MISPIYYDTEILNTHGSASNDNKSRGPHSQERRRISRGPSTQGMHTGDPVTTRAGNSGCVRIWNHCNSRHHLPPGSRRSSRCKPGDRNFGRVGMAARRRASGVWEKEKKVGESAPIADAFAARDHLTHGSGRRRMKRRGRMIRERHRHYCLPASSSSSSDLSPAVGPATDDLQHQHQHDHRSQHL